MLLHQKVTYFNAYLTYRRLKVLFSGKFKIYTQFYTQKLRYGKIFCDILILGEFYKRLIYSHLRIL